jgi:hypothetical protein
MPAGTVGQSSTISSSLSSKRQRRRIFYRTTIATKGVVSRAAACDQRLLVVVVLVKQERVRTLTLGVYFAPPEVDYARAMKKFGDQRMVVGRGSRNFQTCGFELKGMGYGTIKQASSCDSQQNQSIIVHG